MDGYRINEIANRTGFSATTLRYYEEIGLLPAPTRTDAGYRLYSDDDVTRLRFVARAKQLGCTLDEVGDLLRAWDGDHCQPVASQMRDLVDTKLLETTNRMSELAEFTWQLRQAASSLDVVAADAACSDDCACLSDTAPTHIPMPIPIACTLPASEMVPRLDQWHDLLTRVVERRDLPDGARLTFPADTDATEVARLAAAEYDCCRFFSFAITIDARGVALEIHAPTGAAEALAALLGSAA